MHKTRKNCNQHCHFACARPLIFPFFRSLPMNEPLCIFLADAISIQFECEHFCIKACHFFHPFFVSCNRFFSVCVTSKVVVYDTNCSSHAYGMLKCHGHGQLTGLNDQKVKNQGHHRNCSIKSSPTD